MTKEELFSLLSDRREELFAFSADPAGHASRFSAAADRFFTLYPDARNVRLFSVPGRTEIGGNHTDHNHGRVLAAAVDADAIAAASPGGSDQIRIWSEGFGHIIVPARPSGPDPSKYGTPEALVAGVAAAMAQRGYEVHGFDAYVESRVAPGSGLSSSAAFEVLAAQIISSLFNGGRADAAEMAKCAQQAENLYFGKPCGLMDQLACAWGGMIGIDFADPDAPLVTPVGFDFEKSGYALVLTDTHASHAGLTEHYAMIGKEMRDAAAFFGREALRGVTTREILDSLPALRKSAGDRAAMRAMHFAAEDERAASEAEALNQGDMKRFLQLVRGSDMSSRCLLQNVSVPGSRDQSLALALAASDAILGGRGASRVHGGGFAGTVQAFVPQDMKDEYIARMDGIFGENSACIMHIRQLGAAEIKENA